MSVLFEIDADPSKADAAVTKVQGSVNTMAKSVEGNFNEIGQSTKAAGAAFETFSRTGIFAFDTLKHSLIEATKNVADLRAQILATDDAATLSKLRPAFQQAVSEMQATRVAMRSLRMESAETSEQMKVFSGALGVQLPGELGKLAARIPMVQAAFGSLFEVGLVVGFTKALAEGAVELGKWYYGTERIKDAWDDAAKAMDEVDKKLDSLGTKHIEVTREISELGLKAAQADKLKADYAANDAKLRHEEADDAQKALDTAQKKLNVLQQQAAVAVAIGNAITGASLVMRAGPKEADADVQAAAVNKLQAAYELATAKAQEADDAVTKLAKEQKVAADKTKEHTDAIAGLLERLKDEAETIDIGDNKRRQAISGYEHEIDAINKAVAAAKAKADLTPAMEAEAHQARLLAAAVLRERLRQIEEQEVADNQKKVDALAKQEEEFVTHATESYNRLSLERDKQLTAAVESGKAAQTYNSILRLEPAVLAAVTASYGHLNLAQIANNKELLELLKSTKGWSDEMRTTLNPQLVNTLQNLQTLEGLMPRVSDSFKSSFAQMSEAQQEFTLKLISGSEQVLGALNRELEAHRNLKDAATAFYKEEIKELVSYLVHKAELRAAQAAAEAYHEFAIYAASQYTDTAALHAAITYGLEAVAWAALGAGISIAGSQIAGAGATSAARPSGVVGPGAQQGPGGPSTGMAGITAAGQRPISGQGNVTVMVMGESHAAQWLTSTINRGVTQQGLNLTSTRVQQPPYAGR